MTAFQPGGVRICQKLYGTVRLPAAPLTSDILPATIRPMSGNAIFMILIVLVIAVLMGVYLWSADGPRRKRARELLKLLLRR